MSTVVRPSGPLPSRVYWFRRLLLLVIVLALVFWLSRSIGGQDQPATASTDPRTSSAPRAAAAAEIGRLTDPALRSPSRHPRRSDTKHRAGKNDDSAKPRHQPKAEPVPAAPDGACRPTEVRLKPQVSAGYRAGEAVEIRLQLRTTGRAACTLALGPDNLLVKVTSGSDEWWTTAQCPGALFPSQLVVRADQPATYRMLWSGTRSATRCRPGAPKATPGTYVAAAAVIGGEPAQARFVLEAARSGGSRGGAETG